MAGNYVIVADCCDWDGPFSKFEKNHDTAARKLRFRFHLKIGSFRFRFRFENHHSTTYSASHTLWLDLWRGWRKARIRIGMGEGQGKGKGWGRQRVGGERGMRREEA